MVNPPPLAPDLQALLFQVGEQQRWIQDSPVLPNVWGAFAARPAERIDLLITPHRNTRPAELASRIRNAIAGDRPEEKEAAIAFNQSMVVARLTFDTPHPMRTVISIRPQYPRLR